MGLSLQFDAGGALYTNGWDNVIRTAGGTQTALIASGPSVTPITGTLTIHASYQGATTTQYTYDNRDELATVTRNASAAENFAYDAVGNRSADVHGAGFTYNARNQLLSVHGVNFVYDVNGNRIAKTDSSGVTKYTYDGQNQLIRIDFADKRSAEYAYDPFGRRIQKKLTDALGAIILRRYVYDGSAILFELDGQGALITEFVPGPRIDEPLAMKRNGQTYTYHADALGSIVAITDSASQLVQRYEYDAYGNIVSMQDPAFKQPYAFTGREWDEESGLYYYRARYYDPVVGRFLQQDPIGLAGGINRFAYVKGDPINFIDPYGNDSFLGYIKQLVGMTEAAKPLGDAVNKTGPAMDNLVACANKAPTCDDQKIGQNQDTALNGLYQGAGESVKKFANDDFMSQCCVPHFRRISSQSAIARFCEDRGGFPTFASLDFPPRTALAW
jgi:RHS repeat-associated protein